MKLKHKDLVVILLIAIIVGAMALAINLLKAKYNG